MEYKIDSDTLQGVIDYLSEAPAKYVIKAINTLLQLEKVEEVATDATIKTERKKK